MGATKGLYRVWLRGAFPRRTPEYFDGEFSSANAALEWGKRKCADSCAEGKPLPGFTRVAVHKIVSGTVNATPMVVWSAGE